MDKTGLGARLKAARKAAGLTQEALHKKSGVSQTTLSKLERGEQKSSTDTVLLASSLGVSALWLSDGIGDMQDSSHSGNVNIPQYSSREDVVIYQYADPRCAVSPYKGISGKPELSTIKVARIVLEQLNLSPMECIAYMQADSSGGATMALGDEGIIRIDQKDPKHHNGRLFAIADGETVFVRRITTRTAGGYLITCDNADKSLFPDEVLTAAEASTLNIIGRICWSAGMK